MFIFNFLNSETSLINIIIILLALGLSGILSIVLHEVSHGYAALLNGDSTAKDSGRLTFNPAPHFSAMGVIMLLLVGFGWAKPVPINPNNFKDYKKGMITVSVAGVVANLILFSMASLGLFILNVIVFKNFVAVYSNDIFMHLYHFFNYFLIFLIKINFILAFFNMLPIYPLDGYNFLSTLVPFSYKFKDFMRRYGMYIIIGLILFSNVASALGLWYLNIFGIINDKIIGNFINWILDSALRIAL